MVRERKKMRVASNKMRRDCAMCALSGKENVKVNWGLDRGGYASVHTEKDH
jgi:hypothetical protein